MIESEGWLDGGDRKLVIPKAKAAETVPVKIFVTSMRTLDAPAQENPLLKFVYF